MDSVIQDLVSNKYSASKVNLLNNFLKQWSRIDREENKRNKAKRLVNRSRDLSFRRISKLTKKKKKEKTISSTSERNNNISTIQHDQSTASHQEQDEQEESFHYTPASPYYQATDSEQEEQEQSFQSLIRFERKFKRKCIDYKLNIDYTKSKRFNNNLKPRHLH